MGQVDKLPSGLDLVVLTVGGNDLCLVRLSILPAGTAFSVFRFLQIHLLARSSMLTM